MVEGSGELFLWKSKSLFRFLGRSFWVRWFSPWAPEGSGCGTRVRAERLMGIFGFLMASGSRGV